MRDDIDRVLLTRRQIADRIAGLAGEIGEYYRALRGPLVIVPILSGAIIFLADLIRHLPLRMRIGLVGVSSYPGRSVRSKGVAMTAPLDIDVQGEHVLVVDDILDTGRTLRRVRQEVEAAGAASVRTCVLLRKPAKAPPDLVPEYVGFDIEDVFVVGYGLDYDDQYRNWPEIVVLKPECYAGLEGQGDAE